MNPKTKYHNFGYEYAIISAVLFGLSTPAAKYLLGITTPLLLAGLFYLGAGLGLVAILLLKHMIGKTHKEASLNYNDWAWMTGATLFGGVLGPILFMFGLVKTNASTASLLLNLEGAFTAITAWIIVKEHTNNRLIFGLLLIISGGIILAWNGHFELNRLIGSSLIAIACLAWSIDNNITRKISQADPLMIVAIKGSIAGAINIFLAIYFGALLPQKISIIFLISTIGFLGYGLSLIFFILGLRYIGTARTSACFSLAPFVGASCSILLLGDTLSVQIELAGFLMVWGIWLHLTELHDHEHKHELLIHNHKHYHDEHHQHEHHPNDPSGEPHSHLHIHLPLVHRHPHYPDIHHRHRHENQEE